MNALEDVVRVGQIDLRVWLASGALTKVDDIARRAAIRHGQQLLVLVVGRALSYRVRKEPQASSGDRSVPTMTMASDTIPFSFDGFKLHRQTTNWSLRMSDRS